MKNIFTQRAPSLLRDLLFLALGVLLLYLAFEGQDFSKLLEGFTEVNYWWIIAAKLISLSAHFVRGARWKMLMKPLGYRPKLINTYHAVMIGYLTNLATPKLGEVLRCWSLKKTDDVPVSSLFGTVVVERIVDTFSLLLILLGVFLFNFTLLTNFFMEKIYGPLIEQMTVFLSEWSHPLLLAGMILIILLVVVYLLKERLGRLHIVRRMKTLFLKVFKGIKTIFQLEAPGKFLGYTVLMWFIYLFVYYLSFFAFKVGQDINFGEATFVYSFAAIGWAAPVHGAIGAYHWTVSEGMVLMGKTFRDGLIFATIMHAMSILFKLAVGSVSLVMVLLQVGKKVSLHEIRQEVSESEETNES